MAASSSSGGFGSASDDHIKNEVYQKHLKYPAVRRAFGASDTEWAPETWFWAPEKELGFVPCSAIEKSGDNWKVKLKTGEELSFKKDQLEPMNPPANDGIEDMANLGELYNSTVLHNLRKRYDVDCFHTYSGLFLVVINPYKLLPIYSTEIVDLYRGRRRAEVAPHIYAVSDEAYRNMLNNRENQSLLITGESGAGKTENTKKVIQYIATVAGRSGGVGELEKQLIELNPVLEAFGNAKTVRNDNSSRFGKFIKLQFSQGGLLSGASVRVYLLEKSRVVTRGKNERAFHIFYQLLAGATDAEKTQFNLRRPEDYHYLRNSDCYRVDTLNDVEEFKHTRVAMDMCGISPEQQAQIFSIVSGILHLGNVRFRDGAGEGGEIDGLAELQAAAAQFGVETEVLLAALLHPKIEAGGKLVALHLTREQADHAREATAKDIYNRLFLWIVARMNKLLSQPNSTSFIGVLDIAGFEIFEYNSFEQLCINYTNERLQAFFNNHMFTLEQEEYEREKIQWTWVDFGIDSTQVIDLICKKPNGILPTLDEQCVFPKATDLTFLEKLHGCHSRSPKYSKPQFAGEPTFKLSHYAGQVTYTVTDWLEKNKDPLASDIKSSLRGSRLNLLADCYSDSFIRDVERAQSPTPNPNRAPLAGIRGDGPNRGQAGAQFMTIAKKYDSQLGELMSTLQSTYPHFVRCIIPNYQKRSGYLCADVVLEQLRCNGVLEGIRIARKGFPNRLHYKEFLKRYHLLGSKIPAHSTDPRADTEALVGQLIQQGIIHPKHSKDFTEVSELYRFGLTKVFFRSGQLSAIEGEREHRVGKLVAIVQAATRAWLARNLYRKLRTRDLAVKVIKRNLRAYVNLSNWNWWKLFTKARPAVTEYDREAEVRKRETKIKELAGAVRAAEKERDDLRFALEDANAQVADFNKQLEKTDLQLVEAEAARDKLEKSYKEALSKLRQVTEDWEDESERADKLSEVKKDLEKRIAELEGECGSESELRQRLEDEKRKLEVERANVAALLKDTEDDLAESKQTKADLQNRLNDLQRRFDAAEDDVDSLTDMTKRLKSEIEEANEKLEARGNELAAADKASKKAASDLKAAQSQIEILESEKRNASDLADSLKQKLKLADDAHNQSADRIADLERDKKKLINDLKDLEEQANDGDSRLKNMAKLRDEALDAVQAEKDKVEALEDEKNTLEQQRTKQQIEIGSLLKRIAELEEEVAKVTREKRTLEAKVADLESENDRLKTELAVADKRARQGASSADENAAELDKTRKDLGAAEKALGKAKKESKDLEAALNQEKAAHAAAKERSAVLEQELKSTSEASANDSAREEQLKKRVRDLEAERDRASDSAEDADKAKKAAESRARTLDGQIGDLNDQLEEERENVSKARSEITSLQTNLAATKARADATEESATKLDAQVKALSAENSALKGAVDDAQRKIAVLDKSVKTTEGALAEANAKAENLDKELQALRKKEKKASGASKEHASKIEQLDALKAQLEGDVRRLQSELNDANSERAALKAANDALDRAKKSLEADFEASQADKDSASQSKSQVDRQLRAAREEIAVLEEQLADQKEARKGLQSELDKKIQALAETQALASADGEKLKKLEQARLNLQRDFDNQRGRSEELEAELASLRKQISRKDEELAESREATANSGRELEKTKSALKKATKEINELKQNQGNPADADRIRVLERQLAEEKEKLDMNLILVQALEKAKSSAEAEAESLREQVEDEVRLKNRFQKEHRAAVALQRELSEQLEEEEHTRDELEDWKSKAENELSTLRAENNRLQDIAQKSEEDRRLIETKLRGQEADMDRLRQTNVTLSNKVKSYEGELMETQLHVDAESKRASDATAKAKKAEQQHNAIQKKFISETRARLETEKKVAEMTQDIERLKVENANRIQELENAAERLRRDHATRIQDLEEELDNEKRAKEVISKRRRELDAELADLKHEFEEIDDQKSECEFKLTRAESDVANARRELDVEKDSRTKAEARATDLENQLKEVLSRTDGVDAKIQALERQKRALETELEAAQGEVEDIRRKSGGDSKKRKKLEAQVKQLNQEIIDSKAKITTDLSRLERDLRQAREEKTAIEGRIAAVEEDKKRALVETQKFRAAANSLEDQLRQKEQELEASAAQVARLDKKVKAFLAE